MKQIAWVFLTLFPAVSFAETYTLIAESHCSSRGERLEFSCKQGASFSGQKLSVVRNGQSWYGKEILKTLNGFRENEFPLQGVKEDSNVIVLNHPVLYSGIATIVLIKETGRYYFSEISYSGGALHAQDATIEAGNFTVAK